MTTKLELQMQLVEAQRELKMLKLKIKAVSNIVSNLSNIAILNTSVEAAQKLGVVENLLMGVCDGK